MIATTIKDYIVSTKRVHPGERVCLGQEGYPMIFSTCTRLWCL